MMPGKARHVRLFLDFHSTRRNVFYTQNDDFPTDPPRFLADWLERAAARIDDYDFGNDANRKRCSYRRPTVLSDGVAFLLVNGVMVIDNSNYTGELPGQVLRHTSCND